MFPLDGAICGATAYSPAGGGGPGRFTSREPHGTSAGLAFQVRPNPVTTREPGWLDRAWDEVVHGAEWVGDEALAVKRGVENVYTAYTLARDKYISSAIKEEIGQAIDEILRGIIPGLLMMLAVLAVSIAVGATAGALLGALAGGVGAIPGAAAGAVTGAEVGGVILEWMGLLFLAHYLLQHIDEVSHEMNRAVETAWSAGQHGHSRETDIDAAAHQMAHAVAVLLKLVIQAVVMAVMARGAIKSTAGAGTKLGTLGEELSNSRLGPGFAKWVESNYEWILKNPKLNPRLREAKSGGGGGASAAEGSGSAQRPSPPKPKTNAEKGVFGEAMADDFMANKGYKKLNGDPVKIGDDPIGKGIDGVWKNDHPPPEYVISEAKYGSSDLKMTKDGQQMSDKWIDKRLDKAVGKIEADKIRDSMLEGNVEKWLLKVDENGAVTKEVLK